MLGPTASLCWLIPRLHVDDEVTLRATERVREPDTVRFIVGCVNERSQAYMRFKGMRFQ
jgi:hypothetical protein